MESLARPYRLIRRKNLFEPIGLRFTGLLCNAESDQGPKRLRDSCNTQPGGHEMDSVPSEFWPAKKVFFIMSRADVLLTDPLALETITS